MNICEVFKKQPFNFIFTFIKFQQKNIFFFSHHHPWFLTCGLFSKIKLKNPNLLQKKEFNFFIVVYRKQQYDFNSNIIYYFLARGKSLISTLFYWIKNRLLFCLATIVNNSLFFTCKHLLIARIKNNKVLPLPRVKPLANAGVCCLIAIGDRFILFQRR